MQTTEGPHIKSKSKNLVKSVSATAIQDTVQDGLKNNA